MDHEKKNPNPDRNPGPSKNPGPSRWEKLIMDREKTERLKKGVGIGAFVLALPTILVLGYFELNSSGCQRWMAIWETEHSFGNETYGQQRVIRLYSFNGDLIQEWSGRCDFERQGDGTYDFLFFDEEGNLISREVIDIGYGQLIVSEISD